MKEKLHPNKPVGIPFYEHPLFRTTYAVQQGVDKNILFATWGGIGDVICSIPTIMYAVKNFKDCKITVATHNPELFNHIEGLHDIYDLRKEKPIEDDYLILHTIPRQGDASMIPLFLSHIHTHCIDFASLSALRVQLPLKDREVKIVAPVPAEDSILRTECAHLKGQFDDLKHVVVHAGRHWKTKTFPADWWNRVLKSIKDSGLVPILIGKEDGKTQGYVKTEAKGCIDLREKTTLMESIYLLQNSKVLICNDSSPLHMAASGKAWIGFVASVKRPEFITHYREGVFGWRMQDFSLDGMWNYSSVCPNVAEDKNLDECPEGLIETFLPDPEFFGPWCLEKMNDFR